MTEVRIRLFGKLHVQIAELELWSLEPRKSEELLCYLLLHRRRQHHRESLVDLLCREAPADQAKKMMRQILWRLQSVLEASCSDRSCLLEVDREWIRVNPRCGLWLDVDIVERTYSLVQNVPGERLAAEHAEVLRRAVDLYQDDLLVGWYEDWCLFERERLQNIYLTLLDKLMGYCETHNELDSGLLYGEQVLRYDRASERTYRRLMRLYCRAGARSRALYQFERCVAALRDELGVAPSRPTLELHEKIQAGELLEPTEAGRAVMASDPRLNEVLACLIRFEATLEEFQSQLHSDIKSLQEALAIAT